YKENSFVVFTFPIGKEANFNGVVDIVSQKAYIYNDASGTAEVKDIPNDIKDEVAKLKQELVEFVAETNDALTEKYLEEGVLTEDEIQTGLKEGIRNGTIIPVFAGSAVKNIGIHPFLEGLINYFPNPSQINEIKGINPADDSEIIIKPEEKNPLCGFVFKTVSEPHVGEMFYVRIFSGQLKSASDFFNVNKGKVERTGQLMIALGKKRIDVDALDCGDIGVMVKLKETETGDTITDNELKVRLPEIIYPDPIYSLALHPKSKQDQEKLSQSLAKLHKEDPSFTYRMDPEFSETIISGSGDMHLNVIIERLSRKFDVAITTGLPRVPYRETIKGSAKKQGKYKRQSGGRGQYGDVHIELKPFPAGGFEFVDAIVGGVVPKNYVPAVEKGIRGAMQEGYLAGCPVVDISATIYDGSFHPVDSSDMAFQIAGSMAFKNCMAEAKPVLLEPIYKVDITVPEEYMGDIMGDLNSRRGKILGMDTKDKHQIISALVPLAEMFTYINDLKSMTGGRGSFTMKYEKYEEVPAHIAEKIIENKKKEKEEQG
ncbi:MAG TPA: elongation factor G, partial [Firmicutes bacterium]|nr:elongation factor G [Bacillota bacterium]